MESWRARRSNASGSLISGAPLQAGFLLCGTVWNRDPRRPLPAEVCGDGKIHELRERSRCACAAPATVGDNQKPIAPTRHRGSQSGSTRPVRFNTVRTVLRWLVSGLLGTFDD